MAIFDKTNFCNYQFLDFEYYTPNFLGTCQFGYGYGGTGKKSNNRQFDSYGGPFGKGDFIGCYLDLDNWEIAYTKNGKDLGLAFEIPRQQQNQTFFPAVVLKNGEMRFNFGDQPWKYPPLDGYKGTFFSKVKLSLVILTTFEFSRQKHDAKIQENGMFRSTPNPK